MFAKRQAAFAGTPAPAARPSAGAGAVGFARLIARPEVGGAAALALFVMAGGGLLLIAGDPFAGAPSVRVPLDRPKPAAQPIGPDAGMQAFTVDSLGLNQDVSQPGYEGVDAPPIEGTATITLPDGAGSQAPLAPAAAPLPKRPPAAPLTAAPIAAVNQQSPLGPLPVIAPDGRTPFQLYARPFVSNGKPKVALVVGGLGLNPTSTRAAIERLPAEVTLSFVPYAQGLQGWIDLARANGHEVLLEAPMEPADYPDNDPGPQTLLADAPPAETVKKLDWLLSRASGYFGVSNYLGQRFVTSDAGMGAFLGALKTRGLAFIDDGSARKRAGAQARASADSVVDEQLSPEAITRQFDALEVTAHTRGSALGSGFAYPVTVEIAARWAAGLPARGLQLAPASALARR
jgi:polysaccharide deacetylase 2 family uncharacterized protein YibQ